MSDLPAKRMHRDPRRAIMHIVSQLLPAGSTIRFQPKGDDDESWEAWIPGLNGQIHMRDRAEILAFALAYDRFYSRMAERFEEQMQRINSNVMSLQDDLRTIYRERDTPQPDASHGAPGKPTTRFQGGTFVE